MFCLQAKALSDADGSTHVDIFIHSHVPNIQLPLLVFLLTVTQSLICKRSMGGKGAWRVIVEESAKYMSRQMFSGQVLDWQTHIKGEKSNSSSNRGQRRTMLRRRSEDWAAEQHVQGVKKPITVNQPSAASQGRKEGKLYPSSGPPELACCVQSRGNPLDVTYILIFMNALIAPLKALPWPGGGYLYKLVRKAKMRGKDICWSPLLTEKKKWGYSNCNWK